jgi:hypothetical protein
VLASNGICGRQQGTWLAPGALEEAEVALRRAHRETDPCGSGAAEAAYPVLALIQRAGRTAIAVTSPAHESG